MLNMSNTATLFKISNIDISGGNISNRSALKSTVKFILGFN